MLGLQMSRTEHDSTLQIPLGPSKKKFVSVPAGRASFRNRYLPFKFSAVQAVQSSPVRCFPGAVSSLQVRGSGRHEAVLRSKDELQG